MTRNWHALPVAPWESWQTRRRRIQLGRDGGPAVWMTPADPEVVV